MALISSGNVVEENSCVKNHPTLTLLVDDASPHDDVAELLEHLSIENLIENSHCAVISAPPGAVLSPRVEFFVVS